MIARRILAAATAAALVLRATAPRPPVAGLDEETREHAFVDLDEAAPRVSRQIHGLTASELVAKRAADDQADAWAWARIEAELSCDADFRKLAERLDEHPET